MKKIYALINGKIILENNIIENKVLIFNEKIIDILNPNDLDKYPNVIPIDVKGNYISPGFIDIHIHGAGSSDAMDGTPEAIENISKTVAKTGTTSFLPATMTMDKQSIYKALDAIKKGMKNKTTGAKVLGAHLEGPFINEKYKGAQDSKYIMKPDYDFIKDYLDVIKIITLAPEMDNQYEFITKTKENTDIVLSIGHSNATYSEAKKAIKKGISHGTHLFNAMSPMHHREPGVVGAIFNTNTTCELIADKIHVHPELFQLILNIKGKNNLVLITDSMRAGGLKEGIYELGGQKVIVKDNSARLENNTLAGSVLTLNKAVKNILDNTKLNLNEAVKLVTLNPAKVIGIDDKKGSIAIGKNADITVFNKDFNIHLTIVEGNIAYNNL
ncbi:N-acetylglucosamine-6-phosphate deacetylase [Caldisalinibacter kiritimatiensis]|uniref:N-acetylglucosamine-6-phosphate deacetylase n=1 Tax=Caldisalinibacter kiritimatiensis TaxID=1304284 RepID=R1CN19_9FIRM|nr:N-acetylglucosamine-6-phosphate deacetylase [Caldisalinibacter kiritimatiensis]EOD00096.1 N-acetylglucosamine-6-phosphate deacetylase [Caldisalinibacter kiritimatiensis]